jgi:hypothetical protein
MQTSSSADKYLRQLKQIKQQLAAERESTTHLDRIIQEIQTDEQMEEVLALMYFYVDPTCGNPYASGNAETAELSNGEGTVQDVFDMVKGTDMERRARDKARAMAATDKW